MPEVPADGLVIRWTTRWWDPIVGGYGPPSQDIAVYADGTVIGASTADAEVQPMVWPYVTGTIPVADLEALLQRAAASGLLESSAFEVRDANRNVAGAPVTFVALRTAAGEAQHAVHALQTPSDPEIVGGWELRTLIDDLQERTAAALDPLTAAYVEPARVAVVATPVASGVADEPWVGGVALADASPCAVIDDPTALAALQGRIAGQRYDDGGVTYSVRAYQLIPGERSCYGAVPSAEEPVSATDVIRMTVQPMFPVVAPFVGGGPQVVVYGDGTVLTEFAGLFDAQPMVWPYQAGRISPDVVSDLLTEADAAGLFDAAVSLPFRPDVADAPVTTVVLRDGARHITHQVAALATPGDDEPAAVAALREFTGALAAATDPARFAGDTADYQPQILAIAAAPVGEPAGGARSWPGAWPPDGFAECTLVSDPVVIDELTGRLAGERYEVDGVVYAIAARVAFPGDPSC